MHVLITLYANQLPNNISQICVLIVKEVSSESEGILV